MNITSRKNERVKFVHALQTQAKTRRQEGAMVLEGVRLLKDALDWGLKPEFVFYLGIEETLSKPSYRVFRELLSQDVLCIGVTEEVMAYVSDVEKPQGLLAVFPIPEIPIPKTPSLILTLDRVRDPGNLGSALRTAAAARVELVLLTPKTVDLYNPKVLRGGMGAHFRLPIVQASWDEIALHYGQVHTYLAEADGNIPYYAVDWLRPSMIIIGGEAHGAGTEARQVSGTSIHIPMAANTESLNASVAAGVLLYEVQRQRILSAQEGAKL